MTPIDHFIQFGQFEGRDPITGFDTSYYLDHNIDLATVVENELRGINDAVGCDETVSQGVTHPLDPLTEAEIAAAVAVIRQEQNLSDSALFPNISLQEPNKAEVLAFTTGSPLHREASVTVLEREQNKVYEAIVDLETLQLTS